MGKNELVNLLKTAYNASDGNPKGFLEALETVRDNGYHWIARLIVKPSYLSHWVEEDRIESYRKDSQREMLEVRMRRKKYKKQKDVWLLPKGSCPYY